MENNNGKREHLQIIAAKLRHAKNGGVSDEKREIIGEILIDLANEIGFGVDDAEVIETTFPLMIERADSGYGRAIVHTLGAILDSSACVEIDALDAEVIQ